MSITNNHEFKLESDFDPAGYQPQAINDLIEGINKKEKDQVLMGVTGSGKTTLIEAIYNWSRGV